MTPPEASQSGNTACVVAVPKAALSPAVLKKRRDFLRASRGRRVAMPGFVLQTGHAPDDAPDGIRIGYTCSKKVGNAVARNRAKRRLREIARMTLPTMGQTGFDYVLVGRRGVTANLPFDTLLADMRRALTTLHGPAK